jgi:hypothetical protein
MQPSSFQHRDNVPPLEMRRIQVLQFRTEVFNLPNYENLLCWACGLNTGNNKSILGAPQLDYLTAAPELAKFNPG